MAMSWCGKRWRFSNISPSAFPRSNSGRPTPRPALWREARSRYGAGGPFLFGRFSNADAMYAPIATRLRTYAIPVDEVSAAYVETIHGLASFRRWRDAGLKEPWVIAGDERDWPVVKRM
jgi:glutathione S-transferase